MATKTKEEIDTEKFLIETMAHYATEIEVNGEILMGVLAYLVVKKILTRKEIDFLITKSEELVKNRLEKEKNESKN